MKKGLLIALTAALGVTMLLAGCKKKQEPSDVPVIVDSSTVVEEISAPVGGEEDMIVGGWSMNADYNPDLSDEETEIFENGMKASTDLSYDPVSVLATQTVSGTNYAYLVYGNDAELKSQGEPGCYAIAIIWQDLNGGATLMNLTKINPTDLHVVESSGDHVGGWSLRDTGKAGMLPGEEIQSSFDAATANQKARLNPVALIASQLVSGNNYVAISRGSDNEVYLTQWYRDLKGNAELTLNGVLDWEYYNP